MKIGVLGLQGDVREHSRALEAAGATPVVVKRPDELAEVDALIVPGGESTTIGKLIDRFGLLHPIVERARSGMPIYGTCAGMILLARDIAGEHRAPHRFGLMDITVRRNSYGRQVESFETDIEVAGLAEPFRAVFIRAPSVEAATEDVEILATYEGLPVMVGQGPHMASSFHPEMTGDRRIHELFVARVEAA
jgi:pyridoxal 5'-phosphate synthase pdxT subunit